LIDTVLGITVLMLMQRQYGIIVDGESDDDGWFWLALTLKRTDSYVTVTLVLVCPVQ
jgi:hypothetical protein